MSLLVVYSLDAIESKIPLNFFWLADAIRGKVNITFSREKALYIAAKRDVWRNSKLEGKEQGENKSIDLPVRNNLTNQKTGNTSVFSGEGKRWREGNAAHSSYVNNKSS